MGKPHHLCSGCMADRLTQTGHPLHRVCHARPAGEPSPVEPVAELAHRRYHQHGIGPVFFPRSPHRHTAERARHAFWDGADCCRHGGWLLPGSRGSSLPEAAFTPIMGRSPRPVRSGAMPAGSLRLSGREEHPAAARSPSAPRPEKYSNGSMVWRAGRQRRTKRGWCGRPGAKGRGAVVEVAARRPRVTRTSDPGLSVCSARCLMPLPHSSGAIGPAHGPTINLPLPF